MKRIKANSAIKTKQGSAKPLSAKNPKRRQSIATRNPDFEPATKRFTRSSELVATAVNGSIIFANVGNCEEWKLASSPLQGSARDPLNEVKQ